jgi:hypothetical protein
MFSKIFLKYPKKFIILQGGIAYFHIEVHYFECSLAHCDIFLEYFQIEKIYCACDCLYTILFSSSRVFRNSDMTYLYGILHFLLMPKAFDT